MNAKKLITLLFTCLLLSSCSGKLSMSGKSQYPFVANGVEIKSSPQKVVTLSPALTEAVYTLGYGGKLVGVSDYCDRPAISNEIPGCGSALDPHIEGIKRLEADLVLTTTPLPEKDLLELQQMNVKVVTIPRGSNFEDILKNYEVLAKTLGGLNRGQASDTQLRYYTDVTLNYIYSSMRTVTEGTSAIYLRDLDFTIATGDTLEGGILSEMGFTNQAAGYVNWNFPQDKEEELNPDYIFYANTIDPEKIKASSFYKNTSAVKNDQLIPIDPTVFERQSPMMFDYLKNLLATHFPDAFTEPRPSIIPPAPVEPKEEPGLWEKLMNKIKGN